MISMYYTKKEASLRFAWFFNFALAGPLFSGLLAYAIQNLEGTGGYAGWRWVFIIEGCKLSRVVPEGVGRGLARLTFSLRSNDWSYLGTGHHILSKLSSPSAELVSENCRARTCIGPTRSVSGRRDQGLSLESSLDLESCG